MRTARGSTEIHAAFYFPLRGEGRDVSAVPVVVAHVLRTWDARVLPRTGSTGAVSARLSLRPFFGEGQRISKAQAEARRENENACPVIASEAKQSSLLCCGKKAGLL